MVGDYIGEDLELPDPQLSRVLNKQDLTYGNASYLNIFTIASESITTFKLYTLMMKLKSLFNITIDVSEEEINKYGSYAYVYKLHNELGKRFPSLVSLYNTHLIDTYLDVKFLRSKEGFERKEGRTTRYISVQESEIEKAERVREASVLSKLRRGEM